MRSRRIRLWLALMLMAGLSLNSCTKDDTKLRVAEQFGLAYAPVTVARELGFIEEEMALEGIDVEVEWLRLPNTATIREAALAGDVDAAFMGIPPYLISKAGGMTWRIAAGLNRSPLALVTNRQDIVSLGDIAPGDRIVVPQPGSIQHILLAMAAERLLGNAEHFDRQLVTMSHPDGMQALLAGGDIAAHFTAPPYLSLELEQPGIRQVIDGDTCFGGAYTFIVTVATESLALERPAVYRSFLAGIRRGIAYVLEQPDDAARLLAPIYAMDAKTVRAMLVAPGNEYDEEVLGIDTFIDFMKRADYLPDEFGYKNDLYWSAMVQTAGQRP